MPFYSNDFSPPLSSEEPGFFTMFSELSQASRYALLLEQLSIERQFCLQEIAELRDLLQQKGIDEKVITNWAQRSDFILDRLIRYGQGECGKRCHDKTLVLPWSWRRKCRNHFS